MTAQLVDSKPQTQSPQAWNKPTAKAQIGDYIRAPFVPAMEVVDRDVLEDGQVWLLLKPTTASYTEEWVLEPEAEQPPAPQPQPQMQPSGFSGDSVACQLRVPIGGKATPKLEVAPQQAVSTPGTVPAPTFDVEAEFEQGYKEPRHYGQALYNTLVFETQHRTNTGLDHNVRSFSRGRQHGQNDALAGWHPIYTRALTEYATGYLAAYNAVLNPTDQQPEVSKPLEWVVCLDPRWGLYQAWVDDRCIGHASTYEAAERKAQAYIATDFMIGRQNRAVMAAYAVSLEC